MRDQEEFRKLLLSTLADAKVRHPFYSLRSFARKLRVSPAALSEILNGKRRVSRKLAERLLTRLELDPARVKGVLARFPKRQDKKAQASATKAPPGFEQLTTDQFKLIADWYHFGILSLTETAACPSDAASIARRLGIRKAEAEMAIQRLERLNMLGRKDDGSLVPTGAQFSSGDGISDAAVRGAHSQVLDLARRSLERDDVSQREFRALTLAINPAKLPQAKKLMLDFGLKLAKILETDPKEAVYLLSLNLFPVGTNDPQKTEDDHV